MKPKTESKETRSDEMKESLSKQLMERKMGTEKHPKLAGKMIAKKMGKGYRMRK